MFAKKMIKFLTSATVGLGLVTFSILAYANTDYKRSQKPTYERSATAYKHYDFTQMTTLHPDWSYYKKNPKKGESTTFDRNACPDNAAFLGEEGLRLRAYRQNSVDCGGGIYLEKEDIQFAWIEIVAKLPRADNAVHSSGWLFKPNGKPNGECEREDGECEGDGLGYREIDIFEHYHGIGHSSSSDSVSVGYYHGQDGSSLRKEPPFHEAKALGDINVNKYHIFRVFWTPEEIRIGAKNFENDRGLGWHVFKPRTRNGRFLPTRLQRPMRLRIDINPRNENMRGWGRNILIKSITIYKCIERTNTGTQECKTQIK